MKIIMIIICLFTTIVAKGQRLFDFGNRSLNDPKQEFVENKNFTFTVTNINTFRYKVLINHEVVNDNQDIPGWIIGYLLKDEENKEKSNGSQEFANADTTLAQLQALFANLKMAEQFYDAMVNLVSSESPTNEIIKAKRSMFNEFMRNSASEDAKDASKIIIHFSGLIKTIKQNATILNPGKDEEKVVATIVKETKTIEESGIIQKLAGLYWAVNEATFTVNYFVPKPNADEVTLTITAKPNATFNKDGEEIKVNVPFWVKKGVKIDFSTGLFITNLADRTYANKPNYVNDSITGYSIVQDNEPLGYGMVGFMHCYWRRAGYWNGSFSLGVGIDQNTQVKIMPGISLILGRKERFILNAGCAIGKRKELSKLQNFDRIYDKEAEIKIAEPYKFSWFAGITYNLPGK